MGRNLLSGDLTAENIDEAEFTKAVDPVVTLRRVAKEWLAIHVGCGCKDNEACSICEIDYLLEEAFRVRQGDACQSS